VPKKIIGTLTLSILKSVHTLISPIIFNKLCSVATPGHLKVPNDRDDGPDEVCPSDRETGPPSKTSQSITPSLAGPEERTDKKGHSIGTRINALTKFDEGTPLDFDTIRIKTSIAKSSCYRLRLKAISRGWVLGTIMELEHVNDVPYTG
jgi:hypothetical protein